MDARSAISVAEYLHTSFPDLDREYRDGELVERSLPDYLHATTQYLLLMFFGALRTKIKLFPRPELRMKIRTGRYVIPDVAVFAGSTPAAVPDTPPLIAIEILSPDDRLVEEKLEEYRQWGVVHVWLVDPHSRRMYIWDGVLREVAHYEIPELAARLTGEAIFE